MTTARKSRRNYRNIGLFGLGIFVAVFLFVFLAQRFGKLEDGTSAANLANFQAGFIISDTQMTDYTSMSEADIQNFLWARGRCYNTNFGGVGTRVDYFSDHTPPTTWHVKDGHTVCLAEENINGESAAHIIWQAAQDYKINPKVLIVLIQKETGLITDPIPNSWDYQRTTGYGCPDTAACSEKYYGFKNQIRNAASLFRIVMDGNSSYYPIGYNNIRYSPDPNCGSSVVYIQNLATSALYRYTPYQPNAGALAAGYGTAPCGAYGNRNFYAYFEDWFGSITDGVLELPDIPAATIIDGEYTIRSAVRENAVLDLAGASQKDGANVQLYTTNESDAQHWVFEKNDDETYTIKSAVSGKVLDVAAGKTKDGTNVQVYSSNGTDAQKWVLYKNDDGTYTIYSVCSGRVIDVAGGSNSDGANIQIFRPNGSSAQKWILVPVKTIDDGDYTIDSVNQAGKVIDIDGGVVKATNGTNIQIFSKNGTEAQQWRITYGNDGYYTILNMESGFVLDVLGARTTEGTNVQLYTSNGSCAQKWQIVKSVKGYRILSACSGLGLSDSGSNVLISANASDWAMKFLPATEDGNYMLYSALDKSKVIDVAGGLSRDGANIQLYSENKTVAQRWRIEYDGSSAFIIRNLIDGRVLDVAAAGERDGTNIQLYSFNGSCAQKWRILKNKDGTVSLYSVCSEKVIDVAGASVKDGTNIQLYTFNDSSAQKWWMVGL